MNKLELFIKEKKILASEIEKAVGLSPRSLKLEKGLPRKHIGVIVAYLKERFGYEIDNPEVEADEPEGKPEKVVQRRWNLHFIPKYADGILRYQDPENGLFKRLWDWQYNIEESVKGFDKNGEKIIERKKKIKEQFLPASQDVFTDKFGRYYVAVNGIKVYKFDKPDK